MERNKEAEGMKPPFIKGNIYFSNITQNPASLGTRRPILERIYYEWMHSANRSTPGASRVLTLFFFSFVCFDS